MSGLAEILRSLSSTSGSDLKGNDITCRLAELGVRSTWDTGRAMSKAPTSSSSSAISQDNPEILEARRGSR